MLEPHVRRRTAGGCSTISSSDGTCISNAECEQQQQQQHGSLWSHTLYQVLGGWLIDAAMPSPTPTTLQPAEAALAASLRSSDSLTSAAVGRISSWAIRAAMLDICLPANLLWSSPLGSRSPSPNDEPGSNRGGPGVITQVNPLRAPGASPLDSPRKGIPALHAAAAAAAAAAAVGCNSACGGPDAMKGGSGNAPGWQCSSEASKQQMRGSLARAASCGSLSAACGQPQELAAASWLSQQQQQPQPGCDALQQRQDASTAAGAAAGQSGMRGSLTSLPSSSQLEAQAELRRLRREISSLRSCLGNLTLTCKSLKEENQRLQSVDSSGEELLGEALQQLLGEKSQLLQQVSQLARRNQALQELLDFTAPPVTGAAELAAGDAHEAAEAAAAAVASMEAAAAAAAAALEWRSGSYDSQAAAADASLVRGSCRSSGSDDCEEGADVGVCAYFFATPAASRSQSPVGAAKCAAAGVGADWRPLSAGVDAAAV